MSEDAVLEWLLGWDNPPVRLLALTRLLHKPETDPAVLETRARLMDYPVTQGILAQADAFWEAGPRALWRYTGKHWNTVYLGQFYADGADPRIAPGVQALIAQRWGEGAKFHCMAACLLAAYRRLGYGDHPAVVEDTHPRRSACSTTAGLPATR